MGPGRGKEQKTERVRNRWKDRDRNREEQRGRDRWETGRQKKGRRKIKQQIPLVKAMTFQKQTELQADFVSNSQINFPDQKFSQEVLIRETVYKCCKTVYKCSLSQQYPSPRSWHWIFTTVPSPVEHPEWQESRTLEAELLGTCRSFRTLWAYQQASALFSQTNHTTALAITII